MSLRRASFSFLLLYQALFLNVIVPGHARGMITLDGKHTAERSCCCCCGPTQHSDGKQPSQRDKDNCAICQFAAGLSAAPVVCLTLPELGLLKLMPVPPPAARVSLTAAPTYFACGPPFSSARV